MPYANGPLHLGHLASPIPADIHARWLSLLIGRENVLFVQVRMIMEVPVN